MRKKKVNKGESLEGEERKSSRVDGKKEEGREIKKEGGREGLSEGGRDNKAETNEKTPS